MLTRKTVLFIISLLLISYASMLSADTPYFMINENGYISLSQYDLDIDTLGNMIAVWSDYRFTSDVNLIALEGGPAIFVQKFDLEGNNIGSEKRIDRKNDFSISNTRPDIAINKNNGDITIVWQERYENSDGSRVSRIILNIFDSDFNKKTFQSPLNDVDSIYQGVPEILYLENNNILVTWLENDGHPQYYATVLNKNAETVKERFLVSKNSISTTMVQFDKTAAGFYFVWDSYMQFYDNSGEIISEIIYTPFEDANAVKSINRDSILIVLRDQPYLQNLFGYFYDLNDSTFSSPFRIDDDTSSSKVYSPYIEASENGEFIVIWEDFRNGSASYYWITDIYAQRYDSDGQPIGNNFKINHETEEINQSHPQVILNNGHIIATYIESSVIEEDEIFPESSRSRAYIAGTSQNFNSPSPGEILGWKFLYNLIYNVGFPYPNPIFNSNSDFSVNVQFNKQTQVSFDIYNVIGICVFESSLNLFPAGEHTLTWNGTTKYGISVPSGVYIWVIHLEDNIVIRKSTYIK